MGARESLIRAFERHASSRVAELAADAILAVHAHELAEKIRQDVTVMGEAGDQYALAYAGLIDSEVSR